MTTATTHQHHNDGSTVRLLEKVLEGTATTVGEAFLTALVTTLAEVFGVRYAVVGRLSPDGKQVRTLKVCADGRIVENLSYHLCGTPCEQVVGQAPRFFPSNAAQLFPEDELLAQMQVECYLGVPLYSERAEPLGNLLLMDSKPLPELLTPLALNLMELFALRTAGEIERLEREEGLKRQEQLTEQRLHESEQRYRAFTELTSDFYFVCCRTLDQPFRIEWIGGQFEAITGYQQDELFDLACWLPLVHPDDLQQVVAGRTVLKHGDRLQREFRIIRKDGTTRWLHETSRCCTDRFSPGLLRLYGTARDITQEHAAAAELRAAETLLRESERRFRNLVEDVPHLPVQGYDRNRTVIFWNHASEELYGYSREEAMGRQLEDLIIPAAMRQEVVEGVQRWIVDGVAIPAAELQLRTKSGSLVDVFSSHAMLRNARGEFELYCIDLDIREQKRAARELLKARDAAQAATVAKNEFLANMSHEVRTPLNGIMGLSQLLRTTSLTAEQLEYMDMLDSSARNLLTLINDILDISRIEAGSLSIQQVPFSLGKLVQEVMSLYEKPAAQKGICLQLQVDDALPPIMMGDPLRLKQVLINLLGNAVKFTNQGTIRLQVSCLSPGRIRFDVTDTGIGMSAETLQKLFSPFTQADASTTRLHGGSGLGLAICRRLTELMGGVIRVESQLGRGSSFWVELPCACTSGRLEDVAVPPVPPPPAPLPVGHLTILLVEDQEVNRTFVQRLLERQGHQIIPACDGLMALDLLHAGRYDLLLLDIQMPGMGGEEVLQRLRLQEQTTGEYLPVIALTAHALSGDREKLLGMGFDGYISKPVQMDQLLAEMARVIAAKGAATA